MIVTNHVLNSWSTLQGYIFSVTCEMKELSVTLASPTGLGGRIRSGTNSEKIWANVVIVEENLWEQSEQLLSKKILIWDNLKSYVLLHFVKSPCLNSVKLFSTLFSADIQHNWPILFCICRPYFPLWLAFRFSIRKWLDLHFQGKWPLSPSSFEHLSFSLRFILQNEWKC